MRKEVRMGLGLFSTFILLFSAGSVVAGDIGKDSDTSTRIGCGVSVSGIQEISHMNKSTGIEKERQTDSDPTGIWLLISHPLSMASLFGAPVLSYISPI